MTDKKHETSFNHEMMNTKLGRTILEYVAGESCDERTLRNKCYQQNVIRVLCHLRDDYDEKKVNDAANFWLDLFERMVPGVQTLFYEFGKFDDFASIASYLVVASELLQSNEISSLKELKKIIVMARKEHNCELWHSSDP